MYHSIFNCINCVVPENVHPPPTEGIGNSWGWGRKRGGEVGGSDTKTLRECMKLFKIGISRGWLGGGGGGSLGKIPSVREVWIIYGTTHYAKCD